MGWLLKKLCDHPAKYLYIETSTFADGSCSKRVLCRLCGKEIIPEEHFETLKAILTTASTGQPEPSASQPSKREEDKMRCIRCHSDNVRGEYGDDERGNSGYVYTCQRCGLMFDDDDVIAWGRYTDTRQAPDGGYRGKD